MFNVGDAIVHPNHGAGVVESIKERTTAKGNTRRYYKIKMLSQTSTRLMIPIKKAETIGLRPALAASELNQIWDVLKAEPETLPDNNKTRYKFIEDKLATAETRPIAELVRDITWLRQEEEGLKTKERRLFKQALKLLSGEVAVAQGISVLEAEAQIREQLQQS